MLVGIGYDIHRLEKGLPMRLGGIDIPESEYGPVAHSDGDVLLHAICDALLGAAGLGDIGKHFPDTDSAFKNIKSIELLNRVNNLLLENNLKVYNVATMLILETPKISKYKDSMCKAIAEVLRLNENRVSVKATTNETLDSIGSKLAIAAHAIASLTEL
ncbi:MAG: 2-C-methyl-D-erythritol 2,4-cyclodiphosphate synthase [Chlorobi bacterium]|nr:2-C-methyl-D-erythritol 2,4-cyclodiphosphate synthase [Chlorobiota bacterium]